MSNCDELSYAIIRVQSFRTSSLRMISPEYFTWFDHLLFYKSLCSQPSTVSLLALEMQSTHVMAACKHLANKHLRQKIKKIRRSKKQKIRKTQAYIVRPQEADWERSINRVMRMCHFLRFARNLNTMSLNFWMSIAATNQLSCLLDQEFGSLTKTHEEIRSIGIECGKRHCASSQLFCCPREFAHFWISKEVPTGQVCVLECNLWIRWNAWFSRICRRWNHTCNYLESAQSRKTHIQMARMMPFFEFAIIQLCHQFNNKGNAMTPLLPIRDGGHSFANSHS